MHAKYDIYAVEPMVCYLSSYSRETFGFTKQHAKSIVSPLQSIVNTLIGFSTEGGPSLDPTLFVTIDVFTCVHCDMLVFREVCAGMNKQSRGQPRASQASQKRFKLPLNPFKAPWMNLTILVLHNNGTESVAYACKICHPGSTTNGQLFVFREQRTLRIYKITCQIQCWALADHY